MLKYCGWCGSYQGVTEGDGYQIRKNICEIDTTTICAPCHQELVHKHREKPKKH